MRQIGRPPPRNQNESADDYIDRLVEYLNRLYQAMAFQDTIFIKEYIQDDQPGVQDGEVVVWEDSDGGPKRYLVVGTNTGDYKIEVT